MGPSLQWHTNGGPGGIHHFMEHLMGPLVGLMSVLGTPNVTDAMKKSIVDAVLQEAGSRSAEQLAKTEIDVMVGILALRAKANI
jgi:hypothetical protein